MLCKRVYVDYDMEPRTSATGCFHPPCVGIINPASISHLFAPFYTTKSKGKGMRLAATRSIVKAHGGQLSARNPDGGSTFEVVLRTLEDGVAR